MRTLTLATLMLLLTTGIVSAQSKTEMQASIAKLTAQNDSLGKQLTTLTEQNTKYARLVDTLSVMTGVKVSDLDTVKSVLQLRAAARTANVDSLTQARAQAAKLQLALDSVNTAYAKLQEDCGAARAAVAAGSTGTVKTSQADQLMKLNGMLEQGLITKEEFLKMKAEVMK